MVYRKIKVEEEEGMEEESISERKMMESTHKNLP